MFSIDELKMIVAAVALAAKSSQRLANREGQPESVVAEYRKVLGIQSALLRKIQVEVDKAASKK